MNEQLYHLHLIRIEMVAMQILILGLLILILSTVDGSFLIWYNFLISVSSWLGFSSDISFSCGEISFKFSGVYLGWILFYALVTMYLLFMHAISYTVYVFSSFQQVRLITRFQTLAAAATAATAAA